MSDKRKTGLLQFNLFERNRVLIGKDRSNLDVQAMVNVFNNKLSQEKVESGVMYGFYGHQVRQRWGMNPPETVVETDSNGKVIRTIYLDPALRTIHLKAHKNGDVEHQVEFLKTKSGEVAKRQYEAKLGGFSQAVNYQPYGAKLTAIEMFGFDLVHIHNFKDNEGDGALFDSATTPDLFMPENYSIDGVVCGFDSATQVDHLNWRDAQLAKQLEESYFLLQKNIDAELELEQYRLSDKKAIIQAEYQKRVATGLVGTVRSGFDDIFGDATTLANTVKSFEIPLPQVRTEIKKKSKKQFGTLLGDY